MSNALVAELLAEAREQTRLLRLIAGRQAATAIDDRVRTTALCVAVSGLVGDAPVNSLDVLEDSKSDPALRLAVAAFVDPSGRDPAKSLGKFIAARAWSAKKPQSWGGIEIHLDPVTSTRDAKAWIFRRV